MKYSTAVMAQALDVAPTTVAGTWAPIFGQPQVGSGYRLGWSLGQVIIGRGVRNFSGPSAHARCQVVVERFCRLGPVLVDGPGPLPRFVAMVRGQLVAMHREDELVAAMRSGAGVIHYIDVHRALAELELATAVRAA